MVPLEPFPINPCFATGMTGRQSPERQRIAVRWMRSALRLLVVVERALEPGDLAVEDVDEGPDEIGEIVFEPRVGWEGGKAFDRRADLGHGPFGVGQRAGIAR